VVKVDFLRGGESDMEVEYMVYWSERFGLEAGVILTENNLPDGLVEVPMMVGEC
jgi:hypothetical protein